MIEKVLSVNNLGEHKTITAKSFVFNGGEVQTNLSNMKFSNRYIIYASLENANDILELLMVTDAIKRFNYEASIELQCPYVPYARQDRVMNEGEALSIAVMAKLINLQEYAKVTIWDAHSDVTPALINKAYNMHVKDMIKPLFSGTADSCFIDQDTCILVAPDAGSIKKVSMVAKQYLMPMVRADKHRDVKTGEITDTVVYSDHVGDKDFLIIDDICDGGRTFIELADKLRMLTTGKIYLYVTHGIFAKGVKVFEGKIDKVYCPNVFSSVKDHPLLVRI
jgi:ribose-phosphate pyrophosphokinase